MTEVLWARPEGCLCGAELVESETGTPLVLRPKANPLCPLHGEHTYSMDVVLAAAIEAAQAIPELKDVDPARLRRLIREIAPVLIASTRALADQLASVPETTTPPETSATGQE